MLRELTRRGISTNCTLAYTVPQFVAVAEEVQAGLLEARQSGTDLTRWRSVVTDMSSRWENAPEFAAQATQHGVELSAEDRRWAGVAIFKRAQRLFRRRAYPSKMLICSVRIGPGADRCWHLEHTAGADAVFTLPPVFITEFISKCQALQVHPQHLGGHPGGRDDPAQTGTLLHGELRPRRHPSRGLRPDPRPAVHRPRVLPGHQ